MAANLQEWYVIHTYSGYEERVKKNLEQRTKFMDSGDEIMQVVIPTEDEIEVRSGQRRTVTKKILPGYVLVQMGDRVPLADKVSIRRRERVFFSDDFMVTPEEVRSDRGWRQPAGRWECRSIRPEDAAKGEAYYSRSANPFAFVGKPAGSGFALASRGEQWWSGYLLRASVKCSGRGGNCRGMAGVTMGGGSDGGPCSAGVRQTRTMLATRRMIRKGQASHR